MNLKRLILVDVMHDLWYNKLTDIYRIVTLSAKSNCSLLETEDLMDTITGGKKRAYRVIRLCIINLLASFTIFLACSISAFAAENPGEELIEQVTDEGVNEDANTESVEEINQTEEATAVPDVDASFYWFDGEQHFQITDADKVLIAQVVHVESGHETYEGKVAVAAVVLNRYACTDAYARFDNRSIETICTQKGQFAKIKGVTPSAEDLQAVEDACNGVDPTVTEAFPYGAYYFYNPLHTSYENLQARAGIEKIVIGNHTFHSWFRKDAALHCAAL